MRAAGSGAEQLVPGGSRVTGGGGRCGQEPAVLQVWDGREGSLRCTLL